MLYKEIIFQIKYIPITIILLNDQSYQLDYFFLKKGLLLENFLYIRKNSIVSG